MSLRRILREAVFPCAILAATNAFATNPDLCFAYLRSGDVYTSCQGREDRITQGTAMTNVMGISGIVNSFAIAEEQGVLGIVTAWRTASGSDGMVDIPRMIDLKLRKNIPPLWYRFNTGSVPALINTCGGLFGVIDPKRQPIRRDLLTGAEVPVDPYTWFRCSADRKVVAGIVEADRVLYEGTATKTLVAPAGSAAFYEFNISPNGNYLVFASDRQPLCVWSAAAGAQCASSAAALDSTHDLASVRDDGDVLVGLLTGDKCVFKSPANFSPARPNDRKAMNCIGIGHWRAGMKSPELVAPLGRAPQWITPATADLLREWTRKTKGVI